MNTRCRFAPSPTGFLHLGSARIALWNALWAFKTGGEVLLRIDDTDAERNQDVFLHALPEDLQWMGVTWTERFSQSTRHPIYLQAIEALKASGRLYPCFETPEELEEQRAAQRAQNKPPVYDRSALKGKKGSAAVPAWRFLLKDAPVRWEDAVLGPVSMGFESMSDPLVVRPDGGVGYLLANVIDDVKTRMTHVWRGADHVTNTAVHIQMFEALGARVPTFGHLPLMNNLEGQKLSKRRQDLTVRALRERGLHPMALASFLTALGTAHAPAVAASLEELAKNWNPEDYKSGGALMFDENALWAHNIKTLRALPWEEARLTLFAVAPALSENVWALLKNEVDTLEDVAFWSALPEPEALALSDSERAVCKSALLHLPENPWDALKSWTLAVKEDTGCSGRALYHPLRLALTGRETGPSFATLLQILGTERVRARLEKI